MKRAGTSVITRANWPEEEIDYEEDSKLIQTQIKDDFGLTEEYVPVCDRRA